MIQQSIKSIPIEKELETIREENAILITQVIALQDELIKRSSSTTLSACKKKSFMENLIRYDKVREFNREIRRFRLFGISTYKQVKYQTHREFYLFGIRVFKKQRKENKNG